MEMYLLFFSLLFIIIFFSFSLVTPLVLQTTEPDTKIFLLFRIQAIAAFIPALFLPTIGGAIILHAWTVQ